MGRDYVMDLLSTHHALPDNVALYHTKKPATSKLAELTVHDSVSLRGHDDPTSFDGSSKLYVGRFLLHRIVVPRLRILRIFGPTCKDEASSLEDMREPETLVYRFS
jgi:hypothetical protein